MSASLYKKLYTAYYNARKNKRTKEEQIKFEPIYENHLYALYHEIISKEYKPLPTRVFVTHKPVEREIFAPVFRDRVVHHLVYQYIYKYLDKKFIYDSYSCREGKGTLFGIERAKTFLRKCSRNYTRDAYVLKLDISGYFMNINREILYRQLNTLLDYKQLNITKTEEECLCFLIKIIVLHDAAIGAKRCSPIHYWDKIPKTKSLFYTAKGCGLPIGSLTSQLFSNVYMNDIDHKIKSEFKYYGRYVDDMLLMDTDKEKLLAIIPKVNTWLQTIGLRLHPHKVYLQHYEKGFYFLGQYIKPYCTYISKRIKKHIYIFLQEVYKVLNTEHPLSLEQLEVLENQFNSYFGVLSKANTYNYVQNIVNSLPPNIFEYAHFKFLEKENQMKMTLKAEYKRKNNYA